VPIQIGAIGYAFIITIKHDGLVKDVSAATVKKIYFHSVETDVRKNFDAEFVTDGVDGKIQYATTTAGDIPSTGTWEIQPYLETPDFQGFGSVNEFRAFDNIDV
jgi:hypothetical protein